ncbi:MAG TPA: hypothetical protein VNL96_04730 [Gemmatimonadaceae bacterium]|nr:hypothetical protein [Gemmatimonadaceae bacterium]
MPVGGLRVQPGMRARLWGRVALALVLAAGSPLNAGGQTLTAALPDSLTDAEFWELLSAISEPGGYFRITDNYTSNEREIGRIYGMLRARRTSGDVYVGVGPEQNFTYIAAIRPRMAFVVDIRRQAVVQHLMYKAIFEMAPDRADFISLLFGKPRPGGLDRETPIQQVWDAYWNVASDSGYAAANLRRVVGWLVEKRGFQLTEEELAQLRRVFWAFFWYGPLITTRGAPGGGSSVTFAELTGYTYDDSGQPRSFLASADDYDFVRGLHLRNLVVPVSGDFAGPKAVRSIGDYLRTRGAIVRAFYVSNVEQYLFQDGKAAAFYDNVARLPVDEESVFIRPYSLRRGGPDEALCPVLPFLAAVNRGLVASNADALACPRGDGLAARAGAVYLSTVGGGRQ